MLFDAFVAIPMYLILAILDNEWQSLEVIGLELRTLAKKWLLKIYNKLDVQYEITIPEVISHLLNISNYYRDAIYANLHILHLLH